ncbi:hypothetical protein DN062_05240 [Nitrincola tibetensis]|uniref:Transposase DDE domain-containing protein n=1 Tax=Nitrincola tibetensis TaxID=2219697 RepID=A0A364NP56_9GAMM|nr:transposase [Nitrincola tibetensis]RAU18888.1 hypothetical protein DN062_05240 [Nitrincola tibetensis]
MIQYHLSEHQEKDTCESEESLERNNRKTKTIQTLDAAANKIDVFLKQNQPRMGKGKRHQSPSKPKAKPLIPASEFQFDPVTMICICPVGERISHRGVKTNERGQCTVYFEGRLLQCRHCAIKDQCMKNPASANHRKGAGRQVSFALNDQRAPTYTDWMKHRVDSPKGKQIYSHRMSVVEPVFGNIGTNKGLSRFSLRGKNKVQGQWQLYCLVHNVEKLAK